MDYLYHFGVALEFGVFEVHLQKFAPLAVDPFFTLSFVAVSYGLPAFYLYVH